MLRKTLLDKCVLFHLKFHSLLIIIEYVTLINCYNFKPYIIVKNCYNFQPYNISLELTEFNLHSVRCCESAHTPSFIWCFSWYTAIHAGKIFSNSPRSWRQKIHIGLIKCQNKFYNYSYQYKNILFAYVTWYLSLSKGKPLSNG
jgi:hypothetical protein